MLNGSGAGQGADGLDISAGASTVKGLTIDGFAGEGISLSGAGSNTVTQNYIGTTATGNVAGPNGLDGILVQSGSNTNTISNNTISGNLLNGIYLNGQSGGTAPRPRRATSSPATGSALAPTACPAIGNTANGILLQNAPMTTIGGTGGDSTRNIISGNTNGINAAHHLRRHADRGELHRDRLQRHRRAGEHWQRRAERLGAPTGSDPGDFDRRRHRRELGGARNVISGNSTGS